MKSKLIVLSAVVLMFSASQVFAGGNSEHGGTALESKSSMKKDMGSMMEEKGAMKKGMGSMMEEKGSMMNDMDSMMDHKAEKKSDLPNVGNKICPVSGKPVTAKGSPVEVEYEGKAYNVCCKMCAKSFKKDPEKFIKIINEELEGSDHNEKDGHSDKH